MSTRFTIPSATDPAIELAPSLDRGMYASIFRRAGRVHIPQVFTEAAAQRIYRSLRQDTPWSLTFNNGTEEIDLPGQTPEQRRQHAIGAWERGRYDFQYFCDAHRLTDEGEPYPDPKSYLAKVVAFLNMPEFISFVRFVTGLQTISFADAQATLYKPGDFLTMHDDIEDGEGRLAAYVLNFSPEWKPDWGGMLQFLDEQGHVIEGFKPSFNALNIYRVPQPHLVSQVALFGGLRYSITGWLRARR